MPGVCRSVTRVAVVRDVRTCRVVGVGTAQRGHNLHMMQLVTAPSGVSLQVRAVPVGTPLRITNTPGTGIVDNLIWTVYLEWRTSRAKPRSTDVLGGVS